MIWSLPPASYWVLRKTYTNLYGTQMGELNLYGHWKSDMITLSYMTEEILNFSPSLGNQVLHSSSESTGLYHHWNTVLVFCMQLQQGDQDIACKMKDNDPLQTVWRKRPAAFTSSLGYHLLLHYSLLCSKLSHTLSSSQALSFLLSQHSLALPHYFYRTTVKTVPVLWDKAALTTHYSIFFTILTTQQLEQWQMKQEKQNKMQTYYAIACILTCHNI